MNEETSGLRGYLRVLVTGATGWLGQRVVRALTEGMTELGPVAKGGMKVRALVPAGESTEGLRALGAEIVFGSVTDQTALDPFLEDVEGALLLHLAGVIHPPGRTRFFDEINFHGTLNLLNAAAQKRIARAVVMSSNSPFGGNASVEDRFDEGSPYNPYMGYGRSKWRMELAVRERVLSGAGPEIVVFRAPWFYGPGQPARQTLFFRLIREGRFPLVGNGLNRRSMGYVDSLAQGLLLGTDVAHAAGQTYWIADERPYPMIEIIETVKAVLREDFGLPVSERLMRLTSSVADMARVADGLIQGAGRYHQKIHVLSEMNMTIACDISKAKRELGYAPLVELREGMRRSVEWMLASGTGDLGC